MKRYHMFGLLLFVAVPLSMAQQPRQPQQPMPRDPIAESLFPPELLMQNQKALGLSEEQRNAVKTEVQKAQSRFTDVQWSLQTEVETMASLLKQDRVDEKQALAQLEKILNLEREMKKTQITLMVRIKNELTSDQQAMIRKMQKERRENELRERMEKEEGERKEGDQ